MLTMTVFFDVMVGSFLGLLLCAIYPITDLERARKIERLSLDDKRVVVDVPHKMPTSTTKHASMNTGDSETRLQSAFCRSYRTTIDFGRLWATECVTDGRVSSELLEKLQALEEDMERRCGGRSGNRIWFWTGKPRVQKA